MTNVRLSVMSDFDKLTTVQSRNPDSDHVTHSAGIRH